MSLSHFTYFISLDDGNTGHNLTLTGQGLPAFISDRGVDVQVPLALLVKHITSHTCVLVINNTLHSQVSKWQCACVGVVRVRYIAPHISLNTTCSPTQQMTTIGTTTQHNPLITQKQTNQTTTNATNKNNALYRNTWTKISKMADYHCRRRPGEFFSFYH